MSGIKVFAPATVANVACGYDLLGFAIHGPGDEIKAWKTDTPGVRIKAIRGTKKKLPFETEKNTAGIAAMEVLKHLNIQDQGMEMEIHKKMPFGSGMGSSAASAVAGAMAANALFGKQLTKMELLPFASKGEQLASGGSIHLDNVAPSLLGGMTFNKSNEDFEVYRLYLPKGFHVALIYPHIEILTADARNILSPDVSLKKHIRQSANLGGFIIGLYTSNFDLIKRSLVDLIIEPQRAKLIPGFYDVQKKAMDAGALGCTISGAGPSIFALCNNELVARDCAEAMTSVFDQLGIKSDVFLSPINMEGAKVC